MATKEIIWYQRLLTYLRFSQDLIAILYFDSQSAIRLVLNLEFHSQTKHVDRKYHMIRKQIPNGLLQINYISTNNNVANIFTKPVTLENFKKKHALLTIHLR